MLSTLPLSLQNFNKHISPYEIFHDHTLVEKEMNQGANVFFLF